MGHHGSKSSIEARVVFSRFGAVDVYQRTDPCAAASAAARGKRGGRSACPRSPRAPEKAPQHPGPRSRLDAGGLVHVMDDPTGGVWVKPGARWSRS